MTRIAQNQLLCVYCPTDHRGHLRTQLQRQHPNATLTELDTGWIVVEEPLGNPPSKLLGGTQALRFAVGEERVLGTECDPESVARTTQLATSTPQRLSELPGDFTFVVLQSEGCAVAVRSCSGLPRLYGFYRAGVTAVSTRVDWLARVYPEQLELDLSAIASADLGFGIAPGYASYLQGITMVPVAHTARFGRWNSPRLTPYWDLQPRYSKRLQIDDLSNEIGLLLSQELARHVSPCQANAVLFSGGLDSALVAALAKPLVKHLDAVSLLPQRDHPAFARERYFVSALSPLFRQHIKSPFGQSTYAQRLTELKPTLCPLGGWWLPLAHLDEAPSTILSGWFADECWGFLRLAEWLSSALPDVPRIAAHAPFVDQLPRWWFNRRRSGRFTLPIANVQFPAVLDSRFAQSYQGWLLSASWVPRPERPAERLLLHRRMTDMLGFYAEAAAGSNARAVAPFCARELVELAASCHPEALFRRRDSKIPLRHLARSLLPDALATRTDKGNWGPLTERDTATSVSAQVAALLDKNYRAFHPSPTWEEKCLLNSLDLLVRARSEAEHERRQVWGASPRG